MLESMEKELTQKDSIIRQKDSEIRTLQVQLNESLNLCEKLNSENKAENSVYGNCCRTSKST